MSHDSAHDDAHGHGEHDHPPFLAHHFDDPEQQYDAGKFGMWMFLVTEVLFFSGMFCAYALYRSLHPEVWTFASQFLNENLGAFNTVVLLFSSLTMAWGVRCAQLNQRNGLVLCLTLTLACASIFLGVKAVEYTHKWDIGLLPAGSYVPQFIMANQHHEGISPWLIKLSIVPALCVVGFAGWYGWAVAQKRKQAAEIAGPLLITALAYFLGVGVGILFQNAEQAAHAKEKHGTEHVSHEATEEGSEHAEHAEQDSGSPGETGHGETSGELAEGETVGHGEVETVQLVSSPPLKPGATPLTKIDQPGGAGLFFSIYYCMTGVHALHILGGMVVLTWLLVRAVKGHFNEQYFGPVDYVGLYWHLVDLIWIYLFPLLYLIT
ncbi:MAG: cytochrome oxidase subunit III [Planctomycetota bacterium]|nr:MAG: cytochrome oxidase subunit III [Planctomycetota bacterium]